MDKEKLPAILGSGCPSDAETAIGKSTLSFYKVFVRIADCKAAKSLPVTYTEAQIKDMAKQLLDNLQSSEKACGRITKGPRPRSYP